ncbi:hypothetical protein FB45DRAFT_320288 [Roridomyces roridus]|uniref:Uncharacterized protein n=1 Tax=Roridomyces roridus TaxID=1738132 RepID=A0AAD7B5G5_9AGAR|nr:hypothetical protein FB45DRAFT_320288 [Roridomyces roridus]
MQWSTPPNSLGLRGGCASRVFYPFIWSSCNALQAIYSIALSTFVSRGMARTLSAPLRCPLLSNVSSASNPSPRWKSVSYSTRGMTLREYGMDVRPISVTSPILPCSTWNPRAIQVSIRRGSLSSWTPSLAATRLNALECGFKMSNAHSTSPAQGIQDARHEPNPRPPRPRSSREITPDHRNPLDNQLGRTVNLIPFQPGLATHHRPHSHQRTNRIPSIRYTLLEEGPHPCHSTPHSQPHSRLQWRRARLSSSIAIPLAVRLCQLASRAYQPPLAGRPWWYQFRSSECPASAISGTSRSEH